MPIPETTACSNDDEAGDDQHGNGLGSTRALACRVWRPHIEVLECAGRAQRRRRFGFLARASNDARFWSCMCAESTAAWRFASRRTPKMVAGRDPFWSAEFIPLGRLLVPWCQMASVTLCDARRDAE